MIGAYALMHKQIYTIKKNEKFNPSPLVLSIITCNFLGINFCSYKICIRCIQPIMDCSNETHHRFLNYLFYTKD